MINIAGVIKDFCLENNDCDTCKLHALCYAGRDELPCQWNKTTVNEMNRALNDYMKGNYK